jgi:hypothetical protein
MILVLFGLFSPMLEPARFSNKVFLIGLFTGGVLVFGYLKLPPKFATDFDFQESA